MNESTHIASDERMRVDEFGKRPDHPPVKPKKKPSLAELISKRRQKRITKR
jgi:hypothetical protein